MSDDRSNKGYDDKKEFTCVCCGKSVLLTKFASAKTAKCPECKTANKQPDQNILANIQSPSRSKASSSTVQGDKKPSKCTVCGADTMIGKFASHLNAMCPTCKGSGEDDDGGPARPRIDLSKLNRDALPSLEDMTVIPTTINNKKLRHVDCPACTEPNMLIIKIMDSSPDYGLILVYQCKKCKTIVNISEQSRWMMKPASESTVFNYRGEQIVSLLSPLTDTRLRNSIEYLMRLCEDNGIAVDGSQIPEQLRYVDRPKVVPIGFSEEALKVDTTKIYADADGGLGEQGSTPNSTGESVSGAESQLLQAGQGDSGMLQGQGNDNQGTKILISVVR